MHGSIKAAICHSRAGGNPENYSHSEFISESTKKDAQNLFSMTIKSLDSRLRGNDIREQGMISKIRAMQQSLLSLAMTGVLYYVIEVHLISVNSVLNCLAASQG
ncbi:MULTISPECIES: hypothetical protein [unclassified Rickettsia]|uniref:hypothetical protein n=1 Tax=unclassified Rickettsia TaxID=114295 RepID=UPI0031333BFF